MLVITSGGSYRKIEWRNSNHFFSWEKLILVHIYVCPLQHMSFSHSCLTTNITGSIDVEQPWLPMLPLVSYQYPLRSSCTTVQIYLLHQSLHHDMTFADRCLFVKVPVDNRPKCQNQSIYLYLNKKKKRFLLWVLNQVGILGEEIGMQIDRYKLSKYPIPSVKNESCSPLFFIRIFSIICKLFKCIFRVTIFGRGGMTSDIR